MISFIISPGESPKLDMFQESWAFFCGIFFVDQHGESPRAFADELRRLERAQNAWGEFIMLADELLGEEEMDGDAVYHQF